MTLHPILSAMRRNKMGAAIIAVQMAITLAILCNGLFIIEQRVAAGNRPSGTDEANVFAITNQWVGEPTDLKARLQADLAALRSLPGVIDASPSNSYPLSDGGATNGVSLSPDQREATALAAAYVVDEHGLPTWGVKLLAGRNFTADEITDRLGYNDLGDAPVIIITKALADKLFPRGDALGQSIYLESRRGPSEIVGIIDNLQVPWTQSGGWGSKFFYNSMLEPYRFIAKYSVYLVRTQPGLQARVMQAVQRKLFELNRSRVLKDVMPLAAARAEAYKDDHGLAVILGVVCAALVVVTGFGIVGLTSYWVAQRRRQIGIRRALGATQHAIVRYFQTENLLIAACGAAIGVALAVGLNLWMVSSFEMERLHWAYALAGAAVVMLLGQAAVLWPALRAAAIPPALATRGF